MPVALRRAETLLSRRQAPGGLGFAAAAAFYGFAIITFFIAISMIGPLRASLFRILLSAVLGLVVLSQALTAIQFAGIALVLHTVRLRRPANRSHNCSLKAKNEYPSRSACISSRLGSNRRTGTLGRSWLEVGHRTQPYPVEP